MKQIKTFPARTRKGKILLKFQQNPTKSFAEFELPEGGSRAGARIHELSEYGLIKKEWKKTIGGTMVMGYSLRDNLQVIIKENTIEVWEREEKDNKVRKPFGFKRKWFNFDR